MHWLWQFKFEQDPLINFYIVLLDSVYAAIFLSVPTEYENLFLELENSCPIPCMMQRCYRSPHILIERVFLNRPQVLSPIEAPKRVDLAIEARVQRGEEGPLIVHRALLVVVLAPFEPEQTLRILVVGVHSSDYKGAEPLGQINDRGKEEEGVRGLNTTHIEPFFGHWIEAVGVLRAPFEVVSI